MEGSNSQSVSGRVRLVLCDISVPRSVITFPRSRVILKRFWLLIWEHSHQQVSEFGCLRKSEAKVKKGRLKE